MTTDYVDLVTQCVSICVTELQNQLFNIANLIQEGLKQYQDAISDNH